MTAQQRYDNMSDPQYEPPVCPCKGCRSASWCSSEGETCDDYDKWYKQMEEYR